MSVTLAGRQNYLQLLFRGVDSVAVGAGGNMYLGLCAAVPADDLTLADIVEPTIGTNGYARKAVTRDSTGFPTVDLVSGEPYIETADLVWAAVGGNYDQAITRLFLTPEATATTGEVWALGAAAAAPVIITPTLNVSLRTFRFRQYLR